MSDSATYAPQSSQSSPGLPGSRGPLYFYFDFVSPYAYLAWLEVHGLAARHLRQVVPVPVLFAGLLKAHGQKGPAEIEPKRRYVWKHVLRLAHETGRPLLPPPAHPFNPLLALRLASLGLPAPVQRQLIDRCFAATWAGGGGVTSRARLELLLESLWLDAVAEHRGVSAPPDGGQRYATDLLAQAESEPAKARLREQTDAAIAAGVFGVPTIIVDGELFWGVDSLPHVERFLGGRDPIAQDTFGAWLRVRPSVG